MNYRLMISEGGGYNHVDTISESKDYWLNPKGLKEKLQTFLNSALNSECPSKTDTFCPGTDSNGYCVCLVYGHTPTHIYFEVDNNIHGDHLFLLMARDCKDMSEGEILAKVKEKIAEVIQ